MTRPFFSVVVPTRQRSGTLRACLETCVAQDFDDYEILVVDNASGPETRAVVEAVGSDRVRYLRNDQVLAMSANWEIAVAEAAGEYVTVLGDDDALMPYALRELAGLIAEHDRPGAVRSGRAVWTWPIMAVESDANYLKVPLGRVVEWQDGRTMIAEVIEFRADTGLLPMIYNSVIRRDLIDELRHRCGTVFPTIYPDIYSGFALAAVAGRYLSVELPMGIAGLGDRSNGVATLIQKEGESPIAEEFNSLNSDSGYLPHPRVPDLTNQPVHVVDSFEHARDRLFQDDPELDYDRWEMTRRYLATTTATDEATRARSVRLIKAALADRPDLAELVDAESANHPPAPTYRFRPERLGFDGADLHLDTAGLGVRDVADCSRLVARLIGYDGRPLTYGLPSLPRVDLQRVVAESRATEAERRAEEAEQQAARAKRRARRATRELRNARADAAPRGIPSRIARLVRRRGEG